MSGYTHCACRDCFEIVVGEEGETLCDGCEKAGCEVFPWGQQDPDRSGTDCKRDDAYGADGLCEHGSWICSEPGCPNNSRED
jgi:hypothetical protein